MQLINDKLSTTFVIQCRYYIISEAYIIIVNYTVQQIWTFFRPQIRETRSFLYIFLLLKTNPQMKLLYYVIFLRKLDLNVSKMAFFELK